MSILHDPKVFDNSMEFQPKRYLKDGQLNPDVRDPESAAFGYGRWLVIQHIICHTMLIEP